MTDQNKPKKDLFVLDTVFPNPENIILTQFPSVEEIKDDCLIVLDASTLLAPYNVGKESLQEIQEIYINLIQKHRLHLPARRSKSLGITAQVRLEIYTPLFIRKSAHSQR